MAIRYHSTNNHDEQVGFRDAILNGIASNYGLYTMKREDLPRLATRDIVAMESKSYAEIAFQVLLPFVLPDIGERDFAAILEDAYDQSIIPVDLQKVTGNTSIMWLSRGPTYSFKDFAARFIGRVLNHFLLPGTQKRIVVVATSGDTGGAVAHALHGLDNVSAIIFFPRGAISEEQRRQMTTLGGNIHAFAVNGNFDVCQEMAKSLLSDRVFAENVFNDHDRFTSANSISLGRLLPQAVYPFFAYARLGLGGDPLVVSIPSGNFGDMMGTVIAKGMGLPVTKLVIGVNENREFPEFLETGSYRVRPSIWSPSTAMIVSNPSNFARLVEYYGGHVYDERDGQSGKVTRAGILTEMPDMEEMRRDMYSVGVSNEQHYKTIRKVYEAYGVMLEPHGAVGWRALEAYNGGNHREPSVVYETADPGKFPEDIRKAIGIAPVIPGGIQRQRDLEERIYRIDAPSSVDGAGNKRMDASQYREVQEQIAAIPELRA
jgi:threonine synthase